MNKFLIDRHFGFLKKDFGFHGPFESSMAREIYLDFIKDGIVIRIGYEGSYWASLYKAGSNIDALNKGTLRFNDLPSSKWDSYNLRKLDPDDKLWKSVSDKGFPDKSLWYYSTLITRNPEILGGDFTKLKAKNIWKRILEKIKTTHNKSN